MAKPNRDTTKRRRRSRKKKRRNAYARLAIVLGLASAIGLVVALLVYRKGDGSNSSARPPHRNSSGTEKQVPGAQQSTAIDETRPPHNYGQKRSARPVHKDPSTILAELRDLSPTSPYTERATKLLQLSNAHYILFDMDKSDVDSGLAAIEALKDLAHVLPEMDTLSKLLRISTEVANAHPDNAAAAKHRAFAYYRSKRPVSAQFDIQKYRDYLTAAMKLAPTDAALPLHAISAYTQRVSGDNSEDKTTPWLSGIVNQWLENAAVGIDREYVANRYGALYEQGASKYSATLDKLEPIADTASLPVIRDAVTLLPRVQTDVVRTSNGYLCRLGDLNALKVLVTAEPRFESEDDELQMALVRAFKSVGRFADARDFAENLRQKTESTPSMMTARADYASVEANLSIWECGGELPSYVFDMVPARLSRFVQARDLKARFSLLFGTSPHRAAMTFFPKQGAGHYAWNHYMRALSADGSATPALTAALRIAQNQSAPPQLRLQALRRSSHMASRLKKPTLVRQLVQEISKPDDLHPQLAAELSAALLSTSPTAKDIEVSVLSKLLAKCSVEDREALAAWQAAIAGEKLPKTKLQSLAHGYFAIRAWAQALSSQPNLMEDWANWLAEWELSDRPAVATAVGFMRSRTVAPWYKLAELASSFDGTPWEQHFGVMTTILSSGNFKGAQEYADSVTNPYIRTNLKLHIALATSNPGLLRSCLDSPDSPLAQREQHTWRIASRVVGGEVDVAISELETLTDDFPLSPNFAAQIGQCHLRRGAYDEAVMYGTRALELDPTRRDALFVLHTSYDRLEKYEESSRALAQWIKYHPSNDMLNRYVDYLHAKISPDKAMEICAKLVKSDPNNPFVIRKLASLKEKSGDLKGAATILSRLDVQRDPLASLQLGQVYLRQGDHEKGIHTLKQLEDRTTTPAQLATIAAIYREFGHENDQARALASCIRLAKTANQPAITKAMRELKRFGFDDTRRQILNSTLTPASPPARQLSKAREHLATDQTEAAEAILRQLIEANGATRANLELKAEIAIASGKRDDAIRIYDDLIKNAPYDPSLYLARAKAHARHRLLHRRRYDVAYRTDPSPIVPNRHFSMELGITPPRGVDVETPKIIVDADMPAHGHGMNTSPKVSSLKDGHHFRVDGMLFHMTGFWEIYVTIDDGKSKEKFTFGVDVGPDSVHPPPAASSHAELARRDLEKALKLAPGDSAIRLELANWYASNKLHETAIETVEAATKDNRQMRFYAAQLRFKANLVQEGLTKLDELIPDARPSEEAAMLRLAIPAQILLGRIENLDARVQRLLQLQEPSLHLVELLVAHAFYCQIESPAAAGSITAAGAGLDGNKSTYSTAALAGCRAILAAQRGELEAAEDLLGQALSKQQSATNLLYRAWVRSRRGLDASTDIKTAAGLLRAKAVLSATEYLVLQRVLFDSVPASSASSLLSDNTYFAANAVQATGSSVFAARHLAAVSKLNAIAGGSTGTVRRNLTSALANAPVPEIPIVAHQTKCKLELTPSQIEQMRRYLPLGSPAADLFQSAIRQH